MYLLYLLYIDLRGNSVFLSTIADEPVFICMLSIYSMMYNIYKNGPSLLLCPRLFDAVKDKADADFDDSKK